MMKEFAWKAFKNTGSIDTFLELKQIENIEKQNMKVNNIGSDNFNSVKDSLEFGNISNRQNINKM